MVAKEFCVISGSEVSLMRTFQAFFSKPGIGRARAMFTEPNCVPFGDSSRIQQLHIFQKTLGLNDFYFGMDGFEYPVGMPALFLN